MQTFLKDVQDLPEEFWNPLMVYDTTYFQNLAAVLATTKTESLRKLLYYNLKWLSWRWTARTVSVLQQCLLFQSAECHSVHTVFEQHWSLPEYKRVYSLTAIVRNIFTLHAYGRINNVCILINFDKQTLITDAGNFQKD